MNIPSNGAVTFIGKGRGYYSHVSADKASYATIFDVATEVDFADNSWNITSKNTMQCKQENGASICETKADSLNFATAANLFYANNQLGGDVSLIADSSFTGTVDARFYGGRAQELGGIFAMRDETGAYYYGTFGGERGKVESPSVINKTIIDESATLPDNITISTDHNASLTAVAGATGTNSITMNALTAYRDDGIIYTRAPNRNWDRADKAPTVSIVRLTGGAASLTFNGDGDISAVTAYTDAGSADATADRSAIFGFTSNYMAYIALNAEREYSDFNNNSPALSDKTYIRTGIMLAGIETADSTIPLAEIREFKGKGRGTYGSLITSYATIFDVTATVNFGADNVDITTSLTACTGSCDNVIVPTYLNFNTGKISYTGNNINADAINAGGLEGTLDARFYGNKTWELGGTFALAGNSNYYYGAFGGEREGVTAPSVFNQTIASESVTLPNDVTISTDYTSLTDVADASGTNSITMKALSTYKDDAIIYTRAPKRAWSTHADKAPVTSIVRLAGGAASLTFDGDGNISAVTAYTDAGSADATADRSEFFGFASNYMAYIGWDLEKQQSALDDNSPALTDKTYSRTGGMLAGIETADAFILATGNIAPIITFTGKGRGQYYSTTANDTTYFDVIADVNFVDREVSVNGTNTCTNSSDCENSLLPHLNFTGNLSYDAGTNILTGNDWETAGDTANNIAKLSGTADARFYGSLVQELGGTFSLSNANAGYISWFGGLRHDYISISETLTTDAVIDGDTVPTIFNANGLTGFNDEARKGNGAGTTGNVLKATAVQITKNNINNIDRTITNDKITGAVVEFVYDSDGDFVRGDDNLIFYFADKRYRTTDGYGEDGDYIRDNTPDAGDADTPNAFHLRRNSYYFGFVPAYMALVDWRLNETAYDAYGFAITGFETNNIPTSGTHVIFTGKGQGHYYYSASANTNIYFNVTANANFATRKVGLSSTNTCSSANSYYCAQASYQLHHLNFTGNLSYAAGTNNISGNIETAGDADNAKLSGTADARFYGTNAQELGGTFSLSNANAGYISWFGAEKNYAISSATLTTDAVIGGDTVPTSFNANSLTSFNDEARKSNGAGTTGNVLKATAVQITRNTNDKTIIHDKITGAVAEFDYDADGAFNGLRFYFADKKYRTTNGRGSQDRISDSSPDAGDADAPVYFRLNKAAFGFTVNYMGLFSWGLDELSYDAIGYALAGFETSNIPTTGTNVSFTGKGAGYYYFATDNDNVYFDVTANVNFGARNVVLSSTNTFSDSDDHQEIYQRNHLNFTGTLNYTAGTNNISGAIATAGDATNIKLTGTADARFYGTGSNEASELGGTFSLTNDDAGYVGWFGVEKLYAISSETLATDAMIGGDTVPTTFNSNNLTSFNDEARKGNGAGTTGNALQVATAVQITRNNTDKTIISNKITGAVVEFAYDSYGAFAGGYNGLIFYFADKKYNTTSDDYGEQDSLQGSSPSAGNHDASGYVNLNKHIYVFGFTPAYMARVEWDFFNRTTYTNYSASGFAITGFETATIPTTGTAASFTGKGEGRYYDTSNSNSLSFNVTANVNFATRNVALSSTNTCTHNYDCQNTLLPHLNFTGTLSYAAGTNNISGTIETAGNATNTKLTGTADARFYGPATEELGGTFTLSNANSGYVGWFGAQRD
ncbi:MAG: transferrin-binding protein-like solute binding protein [Alphaproteobacteria bacterium]|nr:transferrin-binding protein-like solute binding protein [Alphaproteobacteria bacterium]